MDLSIFRKEYSVSRGLSRENLDPDPIKQFGKWFKDACEDKVLEPNAFILSTISQDNQPSCRTVLLKKVDSHGFFFYSNYGSHKADDIAGNNKVGLVFPWISQARQVCIEGVASQISQEDSRKYFLTRPFKSQISAWASLQSSVVASRDILEKRYKEFEERFEHQDMDMPPTWGGYCVEPNVVEFWEGRESRLHDRFRYRREGEGWIIERLAP